MYVVVARFPLKSAPPGELTRVVEEFADEVLVPAPGFREYYAFAASETEGVSVAVWESREDVERARERVVGETQRRIGDHLAGPPERFEGDVLVHRRT